MLRVLLLLAIPLYGADPIRSAWIPAKPPQNPAAAISAIRPDVHGVAVEGEYVVVRSAGLSLAYLGPLQNAPQPVERVREFTFRFPVTPVPEKGQHAHVPVEYVGAFLNGIPIYNQFEASSYRRQNLWHYDAIARGGSHGSGPGLIEGLVPGNGRHSPLIGFALDGYPVYGPWAFGADGKLRRMRSSYRLRQITRRDRWPDGTLLAPGQAGPLVSAEYPLGSFVEDYEYVASAGDLDAYNGRFAKTPEYPAGTYAYFLSTDDSGRLAFPYLLAHEYYGRMLETSPPGAVRQTRAGDVSIALRTVRDPMQGQPLDLVLDVLDKKQDRIRYLEYVHERPIHLLIVSANLAEFEHIHPAVTESNEWRVRHVFAHGGRYRVYADFTPPGSNARLEWFDLNVQGDPPPDVSRAGKALVKIQAAPVIRAGEDVELHFEFTDSRTQAMLEPYLGAWAHIAIAAAGLGSFIHAHPLEEGGSIIRENEAHTHSPEILGAPPGRIRVLTAFPAAGRYKLWLQFQSAGKIETVPFELQVADAAAKAEDQPVPSDAIRIEIHSGGFQPARVAIPAGKPVKLAFVRSSDPNCGSKVVFPDLNIARDVPMGRVTVIELPPQKAGEIGFACGMGMYRGAVVAR